MMGLWIVPVLLVSLGLTVALEEGFGWLTGVRDRWDILLVLLVNLLTNPAVVFLYYVNCLYLGWNRTVITVGLEAAAIAVEAVCYKTAAGNIRHPWLFSIGANLVSFTLGAMITRYI